MKRYPLITEITTQLTAAEAFQILHGRPFSFFLDSGMNPEDLGRYSFIGSDPFLVLKSHGMEITLISSHKNESIRGNPFDIVGELLKKYALESCLSHIPFKSGVVGYFGYDMCHFIEHLPSKSIDDLNLPECYMAFYDLIITFDHLEGKTYIVSSGFPEQDEERRLKRAAKRLQSVIERLQDATTATNSVLLQDETIPTIRCNFTHKEYLEAVQTAREYIAAGDIFQVNLSQRFEVNTPVPSYKLYQQLRQVNPAPFAAYLDMGEATIISASPERFLRVNGDMVESRPMKGTRPRGTFADADDALANELKDSIKDRAENIMIVDLVRNDLGRVCRFGTVKVRELCTLESYATVFQLTSTIEGRLCSDKGRIDLLKACFPGGSITGAPKVRSMEIIDELEPTKRGIYTGSIGYLSFSGEMDLNIVIRTILLKDRKAYFQVGGGIVFDSDPELEYQETMDKAKALFQALSLQMSAAV